MVHIREAALRAMKEHDEKWRQEWESIDLYDISSHVWYMVDSRPECGWIDQIDIQITHSGMDIFYVCKHGLPCGPNRYSTKYRKADEVFMTEEELVRSISPIG